MPTSKEGWWSGRIRDSGKRRVWYTKLRSLEKYSQHREPQVMGWNSAKD